MTNKWPLISQQEEGLFKVTLYTFYDPFQMWQVVPHCWFCFYFVFFSPACCVKNRKEAGVGQLGNSSTLET